MRFTLHELATVTEAKVLRWPGTAGELHAVHEPTMAGPGSVFFPVYQQVGQELFRELDRNGAAGVVIPADSWQQLAEQFPSLGVLRTPLPYQAYYRLAAVARRQFPGPVIGITGSSGKSTTKDLISHLLQTKYHVRATIDSLNLTCDSAAVLLGLEGRPDEAAVLEMGFGWRGDIDRMASMARPTLGMITKITSAHLDGVKGSWQDLIREKGALGAHIQPDGALVIHAEDAGCARLPFERFVCKVYRFGSGTGAEARYSNVRCDDKGTAFRLSLFGSEVDCRVRSFGAFHAANAAGAALTAYLAGIPIADIQQALATAQPLPQRFELFRFSRGLTVIDDTYNATADGMLRGLETAAQLAGPRRKVAMLSGIARLDKRAEATHRIIGEYAVRCGFDEFVLVADTWSGGIQAGLLAAGLPADRIHIVETNADIPARLQSLARPDMVIYCKARYAGEALMSLRAALPGLGFSLLPPV